MRVQCAQLEATERHSSQFARVQDWSVPSQAKRPTSEEVLSSSTAADLAQKSSVGHLSCLALSSLPVEPSFFADTVAVKTWPMIDCASKVALSSLIAPKRRHTRLHWQLKGNLDSSVHQLNLCVNVHVLRINKTNPAWHAGAERRVFGSMDSAHVTAPATAPVSRCSHCSSSHLQVAVVTTP